MESNISAKPADPELKKYLPSIPKGVTPQKPVKSKLKAVRSSSFTYVQHRRINDKKYPLQNLKTFKNC
jgi:hypothetical protein